MPVTNLTAEEIIRFAVEGGADHWDRLQGTEGAATRALTRLIAEQRAEMRDTRWTIEAAKRECRLEAEGDVTAAATEGVEMALKTTAMTLTNTMDRFSRGIALYVACFSARERSAKPGTLTERARNMFGNQLINDTVELVRTIIEMRALVRRQDEVGIASPDRSRNATVRQWAQKAISATLEAEDAAAAAAECGRAARNQGKGLFAPPSPDRSRAGRMIKEIYLVEGISLLMIGRRADTAPRVAIPEKKKSTFPGVAKGNGGTAEEEAVPKTSTSSPSSLPSPKTKVEDTALDEEISNEVQMEWDMGGTAQWTGSPSSPNGSPTTGRLRRYDAGAEAIKPTYKGPPPSERHTTSVCAPITCSSASASTSTTNTATPSRSASGEGQPSSAITTLRRPLARAGGSPTSTATKLAMMIALAMALSSAAGSVGTARPSTGGKGPIYSSSTTTPSMTELERMDADIIHVSSGANEGDANRYTNIQFEAYDCRNLVHPKRRVIDVTKVGDCPDSKKDYLPKKTARVAVLQAPVPIRVEGYRCQAWFKKTATPCGNHHIPYGQITVETRRNLEFQKADCQNILEHKEFECSKQSCSSEHPLPKKALRPGVQEVYEWTSRGVRAGSYCPETAEWAYEGRIFGGGPGEIGAYETTTIHVLVEEVHGELNGETGKIDFPALGLIDKEYANGGYQAGDIGSVFWNNQEHACAESMNVIIRDAEVDLYMPVAEKKDIHEPYLKSIALLKDGNRVGGFRLGQRTTKCMKGCFETQARRVLLCLDEVHTLGALDKVKMGDPDPQTRIAMSAIASFAWYDTKIWVNDSLDDVLKQMCSIALGLWWSQLSSSHQNTREMDYLLRKMDREDPTSTLSQKGDVGYSIATVGGALIVEECPVITVTLSTHKNCTYNIPAMTGGDQPEQIYVDPVTRNVEDYPRISVCNGAYPNHYLIGEDWICSNPKYGPCHETPARLAPDISFSTGVTINEVTAFSPDFYDKETWDESVQYRRMIGSKEAVTAELMAERTEAGAASAGGSLAFSFGADQISAIKSTLADLLGPWQSIHQTILFLLAGAVVFDMARVFAGNIFRISYLLIKHGWGPWVIPAVYSCVFVTFSMPGKLMKTVYHRMTKDFEDATRNLDLGELEPRLRELQRQVDGVLTREVTLREENSRYRQQAEAWQEMSELRALAARMDVAMASGRPHPAGQVEVWENDSEAQALMPANRGRAVRTDSVSTGPSITPPPTMTRLPLTPNGLGPAPTGQDIGRIGSRATQQNDRRGRI